MFGWTIIYKNIWFSFTYAISTKNLSIFNSAVIIIVNWKNQYQNFPRESRDSRAMELYFPFSREREDPGNEEALVETGICFCKTVIFH